MVHVEHPGRVRRDAEHGADREVDVARDDHDRLADREQRDDRRAREDLLDVRRAEEVRIVDRGRADDEHEREHDAELAEAQQRLGDAVRALRRLDGLLLLGERRHAASSTIAGGRAHDRVLVGLGSRRTRARRCPRTARRCGRPCRAPRAARTRSSAPRRPRAASSESRRCTSAFVPTSIPRVGSSTISSVGSRASHFASTTFCWLPPESVQAGFVSLPYFSCSRMRPVPREVPLGSARDQRRRGGRCRARRARCCARSRSPSRAPAGGGPRGRARSRRPSPRSASPAAATCRRSRPTRRPSGRSRRSPARPRSARRRRARRARRSRRSRTSKETSVKTPSRVSRSTFRTTGPGSVGDLREQRVHVATDHRPDHRLRRQLLDRLRQDVAAVAHHGDALADREDLLEPVRDEEHGAAAAPAASRRCRTAGRPRCVVSAAVGSSITITRAFVVSAFAISTSCWSAIESPRASRSGSSRTPSCSNTRGRLAAHPSAVDAAEPLERLHADEDVLGDGQIGEERRLLEDDRDPGGLRLLGVVEDRLLAVEHEPAGVGPVDAGEDLDERRLAGAVLPDEAVHLAGEQLDVAVLESVNGAEALLGVLEGEDRAWTGVSSRSCDERGRRTLRRPLVVPRT